METTTHTTDHLTETTTKKTAPRAAIMALAVVGFITLIFLGVSLALYSAQYVPTAVTKLGSGISPTPNQPKVIPFGLTTATNPSYVQNAASIPQNPVNPAAQLPNIGPRYGQPYQTQPSQPYQPSASTRANTGTGATYASAPVHHLYGLPDLTTSIIAVGYMTTNSTDSFVPSRVVPPGASPAVKFSVSNIGTNATGPWNFRATIPSYGSGVFNSPSEPSLNPGDHIVFTLGFTEAIPGPAQTISILVDPNVAISESNKANNSAAAAVSIVGTPTGS